MRSPSVIVISNLWLLIVTISTLAQPTKTNSRLQANCQEDANEATIFRRTFLHPKIRARRKLTRTIIDNLYFTDAR